MTGRMLPWWSDLWCMQQTIPYSLDTKSLSALEILNKLVLAVDGLISDGKVTAEEVADLEAQVKELDALLQKVASGEYADLYIDQLAAYIDKNLISFVARLAKFVFPHFYWDGECWRFAIDVPESWDFLTFEWTFEDDLTWHINLRY